MFRRVGWATIVFSGSPAFLWQVTRTIPGLTRVAIPMRPVSGVAAITIASRRSRSPAPVWDGSSTALNSFLSTKHHLVPTAKYGSVVGRTRHCVACSDLRRIREYGFAERERGPAGRVARPEMGEAAKERGLAKASSRTKSSRSPGSDNRSLRLSEASTKLFGADMVEYGPGINACIAGRALPASARRRPPKACAISSARKGFLKRSGDHQ